MSIRLLFIIGLYFCLTLPAAAGELGSAASEDGLIRAVLTISPDTPHLADTLTLTLTVTCPDETEVIFPPFGETLGELTITNQTQTNRQLVLSAVPKRAGKMPIWGMPVRCGQQTLTIPAAEIEITAEFPESHSLNDIGLSAQPIERSYLFYYIIAGCVFAAVLLLLWYFWKRRKNEEPAEVDVLSAQERALLRLADLMERRIHESDVKAFFIEMSDIVRWYAECLTGIRVPELTTEEFLYKITREQEERHRPLSCGTEPLKMLVPFLESADIVKFAKHQPTEDEIMTAFRRAEEFIQYSVPPLPDPGLERGGQEVGQ